MNIFVLITAVNSTKKPVGPIPAIQIVAITN